MAIVTAAYYCDSRSRLYGRRDTVGDFPELGDGTVRGKRTKGGGALQRVRTAKLIMSHLAIGP